MESKFSLSAKVMVGGDIEGVVERIIFGRNMTSPLYLIEWWNCSELKSREFHEEELEEIN